MDIAYFLRGSGKTIESLPFIRLSKLKKKFFVLLSKKNLK